jgi:hypothetical protein
MDVGAVPPDDAWGRGAGRCGVMEGRGKLGPGLEERTPSVAPPGNGCLGPESTWPGRGAVGSGLAAGGIGLVTGAIAAGAGGGGGAGAGRADGSGTEITGGRGGCCATTGTCPARGGRIGCAGRAAASVSVFSSTGATVSTASAGGGAAATTCGSVTGTAAVPSIMGASASSPKSASAGPSDGPRGS